MLIIPKKLANALLLSLLVIFLFSVLIFIGLRITGFAIAEEKYYTESINLTLNASKTHFWTLNQKGDLSSVYITGSITGDGSVKVYIENNNKEYIIFKYASLNQVTGNVILSASEVYNIVNAENLSKNLSQSNKSGFAEENLSDITNQTLENLTLSIVNTTNETLTNLSLNETINQITANITNLAIANETLNLSVVQPIYFENVCVETCNLADFNSSGYNLIFEIENAVLNINEINYSLKQPVNITIKEETKQYKAEIGKSVKWIKKVKADQKVDNIIVEIPEEAENITIKKIENKEKINVENINLVTGYIAQDIYNIVSSEKKHKKENYTIINETNIREPNLTIISINETNLTIAETNISIATQNQTNLTLMPIETTIIEISTTKENINLLIQEPVEELEIEYYTEAPQAIENEISNYKKQIIIYSNLSYENILAYTYINETQKQGIRFYWIVNDTRIPFENITYVDENLNGLIERIEWIIPHLSNQTFELELTILNVQSYPTVGGNWTVMFTTIGNANLSVQAVNGTQWNNENETFDLKFLEVKCSNETLNYSWVDNSIFIFNYSCNETGYETSKVLTKGIHTLKFNFGNLFAYAYNNATIAPDINFTYPTLPNATSTTNTSVQINISVTNAADLNVFIWSWNYTNSSFYDNSTVLMFNFDNVSAIGENSTYAVDVSKYGNNGTLYNGTAWNCTNAKYGCALSFDGVDDLVDAGNDVSLQIPGALTVEAWTKGPDGTIISKGAYNNQRWNYALYSPGPNSGLLMRVTNTAGTAPDCDAGLRPDDGLWHHVVGIWNGTYMLGYIDGNLTCSYNFGTQTLATTGGNANLRIGIEFYNGWSSPFNGSIDEVRIYNRSLSTTEVQQHYYSNFYKYAPDKWAFYTNQSNLTTGTYTYQGFAADLSGNTNKTDLRFLSVDTVLPNIRIVNPSNNSVIANTTVHVNYTYGTDVNAVWYELDSNNTNITITAGSNITFNNLTEIIHNITLYANDSVNNINSSFVNFSIGIRPDINFTDPTLANATSTTNTSVEINISITNAADLSEFIWGWNKTNSSFYDNSSVLMLNFDNVSVIGENATYAVDVSKYGNNGTISGATWNSSGKYGKALSFDGVNDYVNIIDSASLDTLSAFTIEAWIYDVDIDDGVDDDRTILSKGDSGTTASNTYVFKIDDDNVNPKVLLLYIGDGTSSEYFYSAGSKIPNNTWQHVAATFNGTHVSVFINGSLITGPTQKTIGSLVNAGNLVIGRQSATDCGSPYNSCWNGTIDEVRIYNRTLSAAEIQQHYYSNFYKYAPDKWAFYTNQSNLTTGTYTYQGFAADTSGNTNKTDLRYLTINSLDIKIVNPANNSVIANTTININYTYGTGVNVIWYELDSNNTNITITTGSNITFNNLDKVIHNISLFANGSSNNMNSSFINFSIKSSNPILLILNPINNTNYSVSAITLNYSSIDTSPDKTWYELDSNNTNITITTNLTFSSLSQGYHNFTMWNNDTANNQNKTFVSFLVDTIIPDIRLINPINTTSTTSTPAQFNITWADNILRNTLWWQFNKNGTNITLTNNFTMIFSAGDYIVEFWANDSSNNINYTNVSFVVYAPAQPPETGGGGEIVPEVIPEVPPVVPPEIPPEIPVIPPFIPTVTIPPAGESLTGARKECLNITGVKKEEADLLAEITGLEFCKEEKVEKVEIKTKYKCNGIEINVNDLALLQATIYENKAKLSLDIGINKTQAKYCPWCYNIKQDYDETGIDCGGSCKSCIVEEKPVEITIPFKPEKDFTFLFLLLMILTIGTLVLKEEEKILLKKIVIIKPLEKIVITEFKPIIPSITLIQKLTAEIEKLNQLINTSYDYFSLNKIKLATKQYYDSLSLYQKTQDKLSIEERELIQSKLKLLQDRVHISELLAQIKKPIEKYKRKRLRFEKQGVLFTQIRKLREDIWTGEFSNHKRIFYNLLRNNKYEEASKLLIKIIEFYNHIKPKLAKEKTAELSAEIELMLMQRRAYKPAEMQEKISFEFKPQEIQIRKIEIKPCIKTEAEKLLDNIHKLLKQNKYLNAVKTYSKLSAYQGKINKFRFEKPPKLEIEKRTFQKHIISEQEKQFNNNIIEFYREIRDNNYENASNLYNQAFNIYNNFNQAEKQRYENRIEFLKLTKQAYQPIQEPKQEKLKGIKIEPEKRIIAEKPIEVYKPDKEIKELKNLIKNNDYNNALLLLNALWKI